MVTRADIIMAPLVASDAFSTREFYDDLLMYGKGLVLHLYVEGESAIRETIAKKVYDRAAIGKPVRFVDIIDIGALDPWRPYEC